MSRFGTPSTIHSRTTESSLTNSTSVHSPARTLRSAGLMPAAVAVTTTLGRLASTARSAASTPPASARPTAAITTRNAASRTRPSGPRRSCVTCPGRTSTPRRRSELVTTLTDDRAIAAAASAGLSVIPKAG